ncbi:hypothetical protein [Streptomyces sp. NPDC056682]|uniref:hypothetical protein n=1 Tax=Streptomyces sp. NPDC056682 TaxID=3345909 RepID=UPI0036ACAB92
MSSREYPWARLSPQPLGQEVPQYEYAVLQPLVPVQVDRSVAVAATPATRLILTLVAVHAARVAQIATLTLNDTDLGNRRRTIAGRVRNLHPLINNQTANTTGRAGNHWISAAMRGQDAPLERLRVDRQLEEALAKGPDPLHLAEDFGLDEKTAMRYADSVRAQLLQAAEQPSQ